MKKKFLLMVIPTLLALSACSNIKQERKTFIEDTFAHEEIFENVKLNDRGIRKLSPIDSSAPAIAIQTASESSGYISIRFVAAIKISGSLNDATAIWTRALYNEDGSYVAGKEEANKASTKAYTRLNDGGSILTIDAFNESMGDTDYTHFVTYTMRNIPDSASNKYLTAYLTLTDGEATTSKVLATRIDQEIQFTFDVSADGCYLVGTVNGKSGTCLSRADGREDNFHAIFKEGDKFITFQKTSSSFKVWDGSDIDESCTTLENDDGYIRIKHSGEFRVYVIDNKLSSSKYYEFYVRGPATGYDDWDVHNEFKFYYDGTNIAVLEGVYLEVGDFRIADANWENEWGYYGMKQAWFDVYLRRQGGGANIYGSGKSSFSQGEEGRSEGNIYNIHCDVAGTYDLILETDYYLKIV